VALYESITAENKGFLREDAFLAIILITDEDDCSAETNSNLFTDDAAYPMTTASFRCSQTGHLCKNAPPPLIAFDEPLENCTVNPNPRTIKIPDIVESIRKLKPRPDQQILVSGIFGWPNNATGARYRYVNTQQGTDVAPICQSAGGDAAVGLRMKAFVDSFGASGSFFSICQDDFSPAMKTIGEKLAAKLGNTCIAAPVVDTSPAGGIQADCQVIDRVPTPGAPGGVKDVALAPCSANGGQAPCWELAENRECTLSGYRMDVKRTTMAAPGTQQAIKCLTCAQRPNGVMSDTRCKIP
jgi:hypothetical protein